MISELGLNEKRKLEYAYSSVIGYFEGRLRRDYTSEDIFPSIDRIFSSPELESFRREFGQESKAYLDAAMDTLLKEEIITRYSEKFPDRPESSRYSNHFFYVNDLDINAEEFLKAVMNGDY